MGHFEKLKIFDRLTLSAALVVREDIVVVLFPARHVYVIFVLVDHDCFGLFLLAASVRRTLLIFLLNWLSFLDLYRQLVLN